MTMLPADLKLRMMAQVKEKKSLTRPELLRQTAIYFAASAFVGLSVFYAMGGFRDWPMKRPWWFILGGAGGWLVVALGATWGSFGRGGRMVGRPQQALLAVAVLTPLLMFGWMMVWGVSCPGTWPHKLGLKCLTLTLIIAALPLWTLIRARRGTDPVHPGSTGAALGATAGAWAGVVADLWCPIAYASHVLIGHILPLVILTGFGAYLGRRYVGVRRPS
jgi:hypothetical protein